MKCVETEIPILTSDSNSASLNPGQKPITVTEHMSSMQYYGMLNLQIPYRNQ